MIAYQAEAASQPNPPATTADLDLDTSPLSRLARAMVELRAQGRTVDRQALLDYTDFTGAEIDRMGVEAADLARQMVRR